MERAKYTKEEVDKIMDLVSNGLSKEEALSKMFESKTVNELAKIVKEYFNIDTLVPVSRKYEDLAPTAIFYYIICDIIFMPRDTKVHKTAVLHTGHDRTNYLHYVSNFEKDIHKLDNRYVLGDSVYNHFLNIKGGINNKDYSELKIDPFIPINSIKPVLKNTFDEIFKLNKEEVESLIKRGVSAKYLNDHIFKFGSYQTLKRNLKNKKPDLFKNLKSNRYSKVKSILEDHKENVDICIKKGYDFKRINELYFGYNVVRDFKKILIKYEPKLYYRIEENERR